MRTLALSSAVKAGWTRTEWVSGALVCLAVLTFGLPTLHYPFRRDHGEFAATAQVILDGGVPYRDVWNPKPPAVFYLYSAVIALAGPNMLALRVVDLVAAAATATLLTWMGRRLWGRLGGVLAGVGYGVLYFSQRPEDLAQNDGFMTVAMVVSAACLWPTNGRARWGRILLAGLTGGVAVAFKYPTGLWAVYLLIWLISGRRQSARDRLVAGGMYFVGVLLVWAPLAGYLIAHDALYSFYETIVATFGYTRVGMGPAFGVTLLTAFAYFFVGHQFGPSLLALSSLAARPLGAEQKSLNRFTWGWAVVATMMVYAQFKFYDYHWLPVLPPLALLLGGGLEALSKLLARLLRRMSAERREKAATVVAAAFVFAYLIFRVVSYPWLLGYGWRCMASDEREYLARFDGEQDNYLTNLAVARYVVTHTDPSDHLFIWGFEPVVYVLSDRRPATRFIYNYPLVGDWYPIYWRDQVLRQLQESPPPFILVLENDALPTVTGKNSDSTTQLHDFPGLLLLIEEEYELARQIDNYTVYHRINDRKGYTGPHY